MNIQGVYDHDCSRCALAQTAQTICVGGSGNPGARAVIIGEAPGADEDETGIPFVGAAGQLLDKCLFEANASREDVWITNSVKCRPPGNRNPEAEEMDACIDYLYEECSLIQPRMILVLGNIALKVVLNWTGITRERGIWRCRVADWGPFFVLPTFHPAFCKRSPQMTPKLMEDVDRFIIVSRFSQSHAPAETWAFASRAPFPLPAQVEWGVQTDHGAAAQPVGA